MIQGNLSQFFMIREFVITELSAFSELNDFLKSHFKFFYIRLNCCF